MIISKKKHDRDIREARREGDREGFTRGWEGGSLSGYKLGQHYAHDRERIEHWQTPWIDSRTGNTVTRLSRELEEILEERW